MCFSFSFFFSFQTLPSVPSDLRPPNSTVRDRAFLTLHFHMVCSQRSWKRTGPRQNGSTWWQCRWTKRQRMMLSCDEHLLRDSDAKLMENKDHCEELTSKPPALTPRLSCALFREESWWKGAVRSMATSIPNGVIKIFMTQIFKKAIN